MPRKQVALEAGLHEATVLDIFKRQAKRAMRPVDNQKVRVLGVDEISLRKGHKQYALVLSDLVRRCVFAVLPNRLKETFETWLDGLTPEERQAIRTVSMDMSDAYRRAVHSKLPRAHIVADRFHVMKQLNHRIDLIRRSIQRKAKQDGDEALYQTLKGNRWLLLRNRNTLTVCPRDLLKAPTGLSMALSTALLASATSTISAFRFSWNAEMADF
ncbi:MAG: transposase, partial [Anaerolineae bacterium]|nr:transposase [Anaerolineae bacterium]